MRRALTGLALLFAGVLLGGSPVRVLASPPPEAPAGQDGRAVIALLDELAVEEAGALLEKLPADAAARGHAAALFAFHRGDYEKALAELPAPGLGPEKVERKLAWLRTLLPSVLEATRGMEEEADGHFIYRYRRGPDAVLPGYAREALEGQRAALEELFEEAPELPIVVEFFPDEASFIAASGLPREWVRTTSTVAICKWDRILILSPRTLARGYPWKDTLAHEYVHLALARASRDKAPVWFHEGSAKLLESAWRDPQRRNFVGPWAESLLARAVVEDKLIAFDAMHPSMAALPSSEAASLAFAQVAWAVNYIFEEKGEAGYRKIVDQTSRHGDVLRAIGVILGQDARAFEQRYREYIAAQNLKVRANVAGIKLDFDAASGPQHDPEGQALDPILLEHRAMQDHARIGDLLRLRGRLHAALLEYERAENVGPFHSPSLANKRARALRGLGQLGRARTVLEESVALYPEYTPTVTLLAQIASQEGDLTRAIQMGERAIDLNPFDPDVHVLLAAAYRAGGQLEASERESGVLRILGVPVTTPVEKTHE